MPSPAASKTTEISRPGTSGRSRRPQAALEICGDPVALPVEPGVVQRDRSPVRQLGQQFEVGGVVAQVALGVEEGEGADRTPAGDHRHDGGGVIAGVDHELPVLVVLGYVGNDGRSGEVPPDHGLAGAQHLRHRMVPFGIERRLFAYLLQPGGRRGIRTRDDAVPDRAVVPQEVHHAELGELGHRGVGDSAGGLGGVERDVQAPGSCHQELLCPPPALFGGDVASHDRGTDDAVGRVPDRGNGE